MITANLLGGIDGGKVKWSLQMNEEMLALSKRLVGCKNWEWMPGMRTTGAMRIIHDESLFPGRPCAIKEGGWIDTSPPRPIRDALPDLTDPATLGCLLSLVRKVYSDSCVCIFSVDYGFAGVRWHVRLTANGRQLTENHYLTEAEALVAAFEAAP
jgi:hypothetical protein